MSFLKKHYEKIILGIFFLIFIFSMTWTIIVLRKSLNVDLSDLKFPSIPPNYKLIRIEDYDVKSNFSSDKDWLKVQPEPSDENETIKSVTDFMLPYKAARCPNPKCQKIIPLTAFDAKKCPFCNSVIEKKPQINTVDLDKDKDRIDDISEKKYGLDSNNYNDAFEDFDEDGFNNLCEHIMKTDLRDPKNYPNVALRLYVNDIVRETLPVKLKKVVKRGDDKANWEIQINQIIARKTKLKFYKIGDELDLNNIKYKIIDIVPKTVKKIDERLKMEVEVDVSEVIVQAENDEPIVLLPNISPKKTKEKIIICDSSTGAKYTTVLGQSFTVIAKGHDPLTYTVVNVNSNSDKKIVKLKNKDSGNELDIDNVDRLKEDFGKRDSISENIQPTEPKPESAPDM